MRVSLLALATLATAFVVLTSAEEKKQPGEVVSVVLLGATGDLARKYLWQAIFTLFVNNRASAVIRVVAGARDAPAKGAPKVADFLDTRLQCDAPDITVDLSDTVVCAAAVADFKQSWTYMQVKTDEDYARLDAALKETAGLLTEAGRLFYLSVPPFAYEQISGMVKKNAMAPAPAWTRVVLEKPFGSDLASAQVLAKELAQHFEEEEMYRVDHYLGKPGVMAIGEFRYANRDLDYLFRREHVERVEVVMKETDDCKGRTGFYDAYGVLRDVHQNHLTQMAVLVAMDLAGESEASNATLVQHLKDDVLGDMRVLRAANAVTGQYKDYQKHVAEDSPDAPSSVTPTFASVVVHVDNERWKGVPFVLTAGKQLDERAAYVRVVLKSPMRVTRGESPAEREIIFHVQGGEFGEPRVLLSKSLPEPTALLALPQFSPLPDNLAQRYNGATRRGGDAYTNLLLAVYKADRPWFVSTSNLLRSWEIWTPLLYELPAPRLYEAPLGSALDAVIAGNSLAFATAGDEAKGEECRADMKFRGQELISGPVDTLVKELAEDMLKSANAAVASKGSFHLALSGGTTPARLFHHLAHFVPAFPWTRTHIWQVDERCAEMGSSERNFAALSDQLLSNVVPTLPHYQVHPMPVHLASGLCHADDQGARQYETELARTVTNGALDWVLLGMGGDGHTASIFPGSADATDSDDGKLVKMTEAKGYPTTDRMSLSLAAINRAARIVVLVAGKAKQGIMKELGDSPKSDVAKWPVTGVQSPVWYVDSDAMAL